MLSFAGMALSTLASFMLLGQISHPVFHYGYSFNSDRVRGDSPAV
jgi:hypothetical protein